MDHIIVRDEGKDVYFSLEFKEEVKEFVQDILLEQVSKSIYAKVLYVNRTEVDMVIITEDSQVKVNVVEMKKYPFGFLYDKNNGIVYAIDEFPKEFDEFKDRRKFCWVRKGNLFFVKLKD